MNRCIISVPCGQLSLKEEDGCLVGCEWTQEKSFGEPADSVLREAANQIREYFEGKRKVFDIPLRGSGTSFQEAVWNVLRSVPYGQTLSYGEMADRIGHPHSARAVGNACGKNPIVLLIPCHRIKRRQGDGGYIGGAECKKALWKLEGIR